MVKATQVPQMRSLIALSPSGQQGHLHIVHIYEHIRPEFFMQSVVPLQQKGRDVMLTAARGVGECFDTSSA